MFTGKPNERIKKFQVLIYLRAIEIKRGREIERGRENTKESPCYCLQVCNLKPFPIANSVFPQQHNNKQAAYLLGQALPLPPSNIRQLSHIWPPTPMLGGGWIWPK
jgi:hypothetical protein